MTTTTKIEQPFYSLLNRPKTQTSESGKDIYEWEYLTKDGKIEKGTTNAYEKIQSYARQTEYKLKFEKGELEDVGSGLYMDVSQLGTDYSSINEYIGNLVNRLKQDLQNQSVQGQNGENNNKTTEVKPKGTEIKEQSLGAGDSTNGGISK